MHERGKRTRLATTGLLLATIATTAALNLPARAQDAPAPAPVPAAPRAVDASAKLLLAMQLEDLARQVLTVGDKTDGDRLAMATAMLGRATALAPDRADLWRLRMEAAELSGDHDALLDALRGYLKAEPADDAAQLRLIDLLLARKQTAEERLAGYEKLVDGPMASQLTPALRSRLASRGALLARELDDQPRYSALLKRAVSLDRTNRGAMAELFRVLSTRSEATSRVERAQALLLLQAADPVNAELRRAVGRMLVECGDYESAARWYLSAHALSTMQGQGMPPMDDVADWATAIWGAGQPKSAATMIGSLREAMKAMADAQAKRDDKPPEPVRLPPRVAAIEAAVADAAGDAAHADTAFDELSLELGEMAKDDPDNPQLLTQVIWSRLLLNRKLDTVDGTLKRLGELLPADDVRLARLGGWAAFRGGDQAKARQMLTPLADTDELAALGLGMLAPPEDAAGRSEQLAMLRRVFERAPNSVAAVIAAQRMRELGGRAQMTDECQRVARLAEQVPDELRDMAVDRRRSLRVRIEPASVLVEYAQPIVLTVTLENATRTPLSLGADGTIPATMFIVPVAQIAGQASQPMPPQVVDLGRRLVLGPGESVSVPVHLGGVPLSALLKARPDLPVTLTASGVLNPLLVQGGLAPGPMGLSTAARPVTSGGRAINPEAVERHTANLNSDDPSVVMRSAAWLLRVATIIMQDRPEAGKRLSDAVAGRFASLDPVQQAFVIGYAGNTDAVRKAIGPIVDAAVASDDEAVQYVLLMTLVDSPTSTILEAALRRRDTPIGRFAEHMRSAWQTAEQAKKAAGETGAADPVEPEGPGVPTIPEVPETPAVEPQK